MAISMVRILMLGFLVHVACPVVCRADTITVRKDGSANFISINEALEVLPYANGVNNVIIIGPGIYDEQLILQGEEGWNSEEFPTSEKLTDDGLKAAFESHTDRLELRGEDPLDPPVIGVKETMVERFSFFPDAATKDFQQPLFFAEIKSRYEMWRSGTQPQPNTRLAGWAAIFASPIAGLPRREPQGAM